MKNFNCKRCGKCCLESNELPLTEKEVEKIEMFFYKNYPKRHLRNYIDFSMNEAYSENTLNHGLACPFLRKQNGEYKCIIHDIKPKVCKNFPTSKKHALGYCDCEGVKLDKSKKE